MVGWHHDTLASLSHNRLPAFLHLELQHAVVLTDPIAPLFEAHSATSGGDREVADPIGHGCHTYVHLTAQYAELQHVGSRDKAATRHSLYAHLGAAKEAHGAAVEEPQQGLRRGIGPYVVSHGEQRIGRRPRPPRGTGAADQHPAPLDPESHPLLHPPPAGEGGC